MEEATKESALKRVTELVALFDEHYENYHQTGYDEAKTRGTFIDEFFKALGWDIHNKEGVDESYRDVIPEDKIKVEGRTKAPDYCFTIRGQRKFFVEAKKPFVPIKTDNASVFQLRRYGYHNKLPISIISNFEEFAVYDCTKKPFFSDKTSIGRIRYIPYKEYLKEFDFIWNIFSKESVLKGRYDKFVKSDTEKRGTSTIDTDFLVSLNEWRKYLATNIAKNNHRLTQEDVQYAVQQTIDRIIFLIFCEYKKIEAFGNLKHATNQGNHYKNLFELFSQADDKYNSGLFDFHKDRISEKLEIDNKIIKNIITDIYSNNEYDFGILPIEILGNAYEQFLGKVIRITPGHIVKIEDKPEVKKAGGVFYTPQYIVDYIVQHTIGKLVRGKTPEQIKKIKIVDPACGSGSFLLGAYQFLLNFHTDYYKKKGYLEKKIKNNPLTPEGRLTTEIKREILLNNIFGVDIDPQAVEVTKLSLLLKAMEGETEVSIKRQFQLVRERVLPNIDGNIKCGNSLISHDFFNGEMELDKEEREQLKKKINPFDWKAGFPEIFKQGGFDCIIGNPPYVNNKELSIEQKVYFESKYKTAVSQFDLYTLFIENAFYILKQNGFFSYIIPDAILDRSSATSLRKFIYLNSKILAIFQINRVFKDANVGNAIIILQKKTNTKGKFNFYKCSTPQDFYSDKVIFKTISQGNVKNFRNHSFLFVDDNEWAVIQKIFKQKITFGSIAFMGRGEELGKSSNLAKSSKGKNYIGLIYGEDIHRYYLKKPDRFIARNNVSKQEKLYDSKIVVRQVGEEINASYDKNKYITIQSVYTIIPNTENNHKFILGILNSKMIDFIYQKLFKSKELFPRILLESLKEIPIPQINFKKKNDKSAHDEIVKQVDKLLQLNKDLRKTRLPLQEDKIRNQILYSENYIDELVFELYNLSKKDIETIKNNLQ